MKYCKKCGTEKPKTEFHKNSALIDGLCAYCKPCMIRKSIEWQKKNPDRHASLRKAWKKENPKKDAAHTKKWQDSNRGRVREKDREWKAANPSYRYATDSARRSREKGATGSHTLTDVMWIFYSQRGLCANCNSNLEKIGRNKFHVDHVTPLARGGSNDKYNLQCLCPPCNLKKSAKDPVDWAQENGRLI